MSVKKIAINGMGRIGKNILRVLLSSVKDYPFEVVALNDLGNIELLTHLLKYDSIYGLAPFEISCTDDTISAAGQKIKVYSEPDFKKLPWQELGVDIVLECTGIAKQREQAALHLAAGAKQVLLSHPCKTADKTIVYGINHSSISREDKVISNASCTTNCLAPTALVLDENFGIDYGFMTTIHAYTNDQVLLDKPQGDLRRSRSALESIIPAATGAASAIDLVMPKLAGKLIGSAKRVPTAAVSCIDLVVKLQQEASLDALNLAFVSAVEGRLAKITTTVTEPLVSCDFKGSTASAIFDLTQTAVHGDLVKVVAWYDNEYGFTHRMLDTCKHILNCS